MQISSSNIKYCFKNKIAFQCRINLEKASDEPNLQTIHFCFVNDYEVHIQKFDSAHPEIKCLKAQPYRHCMYGYSKIVD